ncbi:MAG: hypothetical protein EB005_03040, partial [Actinobacteria bacterium]|nr:hypothetical protein [Actinomycetota bacterium]
MATPRGPTRAPSSATHHTQRTHATTGDTTTTAIGSGTTAAMAKSGTAVVITIEATGTASGFA